MFQILDGGQKAVISYHYLRGALRYPNGRAASAGYKRSNYKQNCCHSVWVFNSERQPKKQAHE